MQHEPESPNDEPPNDEPPNDEPPNDEPPKFQRYEPSVRVVTVFFAAVLGFGLKHLLDTTPVNVQDPVARYPVMRWTVELYTYKWLFFWWLPSSS